MHRDRASWQQALQDAWIQADLSLFINSKIINLVHQLI